MRARHPKLVGVLWFIFVLIFVTSMLTLSFFLTARFYTLANLNPPALVIQIVNTLLGLLFAGVIIGGVSHFARARGWVPEVNYHPLKRVA